MQIDETLIAGALGGAFLGLFRLAITLVSRWKDSDHVPRYGSLVGSHFLLAAVYAVIGGGVAWAMAGRAGDFLQGLSALALIALFAGDSLKLQEGGNAHA